MKYRILAFILIITTLIINTPLTVFATSWPPAVEISANSAILMDADTGAVLYEKNAHETANPYGATAMLTALLGFEQCDLNEEIIFSHEATHSYSSGDFNQGILTNEKLTVEQTIRAILMKSACEAAYGLGEHISNSMSSFTELMNKRAKELGAINTNFNNASGYAKEGHVSTAYDMAMIARACFDNNEFMNISGSTATYQIPATNKYHQIRYMSNSHAMLKGKKYAYEYCVGGKIGQKNSRDASNLTLVTFAQKENIRLICVLMGTQNPDCYTDTTNLFDYGFNHFNKVNIDNASFLELLSISDNTSFLNTIFPGNTYTLGLEENLGVLLPNGASLEDITLSTTLANDCFANVTLKYNDHVVGKGRLTAISGSIYTDNLPHIDNSPTYVKTGQNVTIINIWLIVAIASGVLIILLLISYFIIIKYTKYGRSLKYRRY